MLPNCRYRSAKSLAATGIACSGSNGSAKRRSAAVSGMNWAMPCAPAGLVTPAWKRLSTQTRRVRRPTETWLECAALSTIQQAVSSIVSVDLACAGSAPTATADTNSPMVSQAKPSPGTAKRCAGVRRRRIILRRYHPMPPTGSGLEMVTNPYGGPRVRILLPPPVRWSNQPS